MPSPTGSTHRGLAGAVVVLAVAGALLARADLGPRHVRVAGLADRDVELVIENFDGEPVGVVAGGDLVSRPTGGAMRDDEAMLTATNEAPAASGPTDEIRPDRMTDTVTATDYFEAFTPAVAPYKRVSAYDAVRVDPDGTPVLHVADPALTPLSIGSGRAPGPRDAFWGTVMLDFRRGRRVGLPSVAPDARILHVRTEPATDLVLGRDSAGNVHAESIEPGAGIVRLTFLTDVARGFFGQDVPSARTDALAARVPEVPASVRERALRFAAELGVSPASPLDETLSALVAHFRAFVEADSIPGQTGDAYLDLARGGVGVCRHRAYAFTVTALGLGIPARYVQNEAHAWVEVELPQRGFLRIDLGGSATTVNAHGLQDRPKHEVEAADPFPQPEIFVRDYLRRSVAPFEAPQPSAGDGARDGSSSTNDDGSGNGRTEPGGDAQEPGSGDSSGPPVGADDPSATQDQAGLGEDGASMDASSGTNPPGGGSASDAAGGGDEAQDANRAPTEVVLSTQALRVYRGQMLDLAGTVRARDGRPVARGRVEVRVGASRLLGVTLTDEHGGFSVSLGIPPDLGLGGHPLRIEFVGDRTFAPSSAL